MRLDNHDLVLISYFFPPAGGSSAAASVRLGKFAKYLPEFGWSSLIVSADEGTFDALDETLVFAPDAAVTRVRDSIGRFRGRDRVSPLLPTPGLLLPWAIRAAQTAVALTQMHKPRLILASTPPVAGLIAGYLAHKRTGLPLVLDYRDQWTLSPYRSGPAILRQWDKWLEKHVLKRASLVLVSNEGRLREHEAFWGQISPKSIVISNGYDGRDFASVRPDRTPAQSLQSEVVIRHLGAIYGPRATTTRLLLNAMNEYLRSKVEAPTIRMQFTGTVPNCALDLDSVSSPQLVIEHRQQASHREALALELGADVLLLLIGRHAQTNAETSSKVFEYLATGRPILVGGESQLLRKLLVGVDHVFWAGDEPSQATFAQFFNWLSEHGQGTSRDRALAYLETQHPAHDRRNIARQLALALEGV